MESIDTILSRGDVHQSREAVRRMVQALVVADYESTGEVCNDVSDYIAFAVETDRQIRQALPMPVDRLGYAAGGAGTGGDNAPV